MSIKSRTVTDEICDICGRLIPKGTPVLTRMKLLSEKPPRVRSLYFCAICLLQGRVKE